MMGLLEKIIQIYPELTMDSFRSPIANIRLQNDSDGRGDYIAEWNHPVYQKPKEEQLQGVN